MAFQGDSIFWVEVEKIVPNPFQPRKEFNSDKLKELSESIRMYGILQPLTVTRNEIQSEDGAFYTEYELIAGERRLRASKLAGLAQVPVIIRSGEDTEQEKLELAIIENLQREDLNAVDRALAFKQLAEVFELSHAQVGKKVGRSREYVSNSIRLLALPDCILNSLSLGDISEGHARTLLMLRERPEEQDVVYREILLKKLSVREVERIARKIATDKVRKRKWTNSDAHLIEIEKEFTNTLGTRVQIAKTEFGGKLTIDYFSDDDLQKLLSLIKQQEKKPEEKDTTDEENDDESQTVIQEMSPEASLLAKLAVATPLELVDDSRENMLSQAPVASETPPDASQKDEATTPNEEVSQAVAPTTPRAATIGTAAGYLETERIATEDPTSEEGASVTPTPESSVSIEDEFAFLAKHIENTSPEVSDSKQFVTPPAVAPLGELKKIQSDPESIATQAQSAVNELTEAVADVEIPPVSHQNDEEDDLYSMKNFSL